MEYQLTAEIVPPADSPELDALQRLGVAALLDEELELLAGIEGPDGVAIEPVDHQVAVHPTGALVTWLLDAPGLTFAEDAARHVLTEVLSHTELLASWELRRCEVMATDDDLEAALQDPADADELEEAGELRPDEREQTIARVSFLAGAERLHAFDLSAFGYREDDPGCEVTLEQAKLAAGALVDGVALMIDGLFEDIQSLEEADVTAAELEGLWVVGELPETYAEHYTALFAKRFLVTTAVLGQRLGETGWDSPVSTAEALALHLAKSVAQTQLELLDLPEKPPLERIFAIFTEQVLGESEYEALYQQFDQAEPADGMPLPLDAWFAPYPPRGVEPHPYFVDDELTEFDDLPETEED